MYVGVYVCVFISMCVYVRDVCTCTCMCEYDCVYMCVMCVHVHACVSMTVCVCVMQTHTMAGHSTDKPFTVGCSLPC